MIATAFQSAGNLHSIQIFPPLTGIRTALNHAISMLTFNAKLGLVLFTIYTLLYAGFVFLNAFSSNVMEIELIAGVNLAIIYGFSLIVGAFLMALLYGFMCRDEEDFSEEKSSGKLVNNTAADKEGEQ